MYQKHVELRIHQ